jgi:hypothetical protein
VGDLRELLEDVADPATFTVDATALVARARARRRRRAAAFAAGTACLTAVLLVTTVDALDDPDAPADVDTGPAPTVQSTTTSTIAPPTTTTEAPATTTATAPSVELGPPPDLEGAGLQVVDVPVQSADLAFSVLTSGVWLAGSPVDHAAHPAEGVVARLEDPGNHPVVELPGFATRVEVGADAWIASSGDGASSPALRRLDPETAELAQVFTPEGRAVGGYDLAVGEDVVWVSDVSTDPDVLVEVDPESLEVRGETPLDGQPTDLVVMPDGDVWVTVSRLEDTDEGDAVDDTVRLERHERGTAGPAATAIGWLRPIAVAGPRDAPTGVWATADDELVLVAHDGSVSTRIPLRHPISGARGPGGFDALWVVTETGVQWRDPSTGGHVRHLSWPDGFEGPTGEVVGTHEGVWVAGERQLARWPGSDPRTAALAAVVAGYEPSDADTTTGPTGDEHSSISGRWQGRRLTIAIGDGQSYADARGVLGGDWTEIDVGGVPVAVQRAGAERFQWYWATGPDQLVFVVVQPGVDGADGEAPPIDVVVEQLVRATVS